VIFTLRNESNHKLAGTRLRVSFIGLLIWKPFDLQFADVLKRLEDHKTLFELEVSLASTEESLRFYAKCEENLREVERKLGAGDDSHEKESSSISRSSWFTVNKLCINLKSLF
jgi:exonuclease VII small subunit